MTQTVLTDRAIDLSRTIQAEPERVFAAFTETSALEAWFAPRADVDPSAGGPFHFSWGTQGVGGRFLEVDRPHQLVLEFDERPAADGATTATVTLTPVDGGTMLRFRNVGFEDGPEWDGLYAGMSSGWPEAFADLAFLLETGAPRPDGFRNG